MTDEDSTPDPVFVKRKPGRPPKNQSAAPSYSPTKEAEESSKKPSHDARLQYYRVMEYVMLNMVSSSLLGNYEGWYRTLRSFYNRIVAYVPPSKLDGIKQRFALAKHLLDKQREMGSYNRDRVVQAAQQCRVSEIDELFFDIEERLHVAARDMMLPTKVEELLAFDEEAFLRDSDL